MSPPKAKTGTSTVVTSLLTVVVVPFTVRLPVIVKLPEVKRLTPDISPNASTLPLQSIVKTLPLASPLPLSSYFSLELKANLVGSFGPIFA